MGSFAALLRSSARLQAASSNSRNLELALQRWQLYSGVRTFSAKPGDGSDEGESTFFSYFLYVSFDIPASTLYHADELTSVTDSGSWRSWVEQQLSGKSLCFLERHSVRSEEISPT